MDLFIPTRRTQVVPTRGHRRAAIVAFDALNTTVIMCDCMSDGQVTSALADLKSLYGAHITDTRITYIKEPGEHFWQQFVILESHADRMAKSIKLSFDCHSLILIDAADCRYHRRKSCTVAFTLAGAAAQFPRDIAVRAVLYSPNLPPAQAAATTRTAGARTTTHSRSSAQ